jgi:hypothetical protein
MVHCAICNGEVGLEEHGCFKVEERDVRLAKLIAERKRLDEQIKALQDEVIDVGYG